MTEELFKKSIPNYDKLLNYGFKQLNNSYIFEKVFLDSFKLIVTVTDQVIIKVYDLDTNEEYNNFRIQNSGEFAGNVRSNVEEILLDIKYNCFDSKYFISDQANRITNLIIKKYGDKPSYDWDNYPDFGTFKNSNTKKWYALIMHIEKDKLNAGSGSFDVINIKLNPDEILELLKKKGFYKAYHMNKKYWITISLDDTVSDEEIMELISESYSYTDKGNRSTNEWIIPANPKYYDVAAAFEKSKVLSWKQSSNLKVGDIIYLYMAAPISAISYKCRVEEVNIPYSYQDNNVKMKYITKIKLLDSYDKEQYPFSKLKEYGVNAVRGPRYMPKELSNYINKKEG